MTEVDIIKKIGFENESIPFDSLLTGNLKEYNGHYEI
jgi:hypothetical protein